MSSVPPPIVQVPPIAHPPVAVTVSIGGRPVEASGALYLPEEVSEFTIRIADVAFEFAFVGQENSPSQKYEITGPRSAKISLVNWANPLGTSNEWTQIATIGGQHFSIAIFVQAIGNAPAMARSVLYTVLRG